MLLHFYRVGSLIAAPGRGDDRASSRRTAAGRTAAQAADGLASRRLSSPVCHLPSLHDFRPVAFAAPIYYKCSTTVVEEDRIMADAQPDVALSDLQIAVMRVLWQRGEASVADIAAVLGYVRGFKSTTVATLLTRLERRGVVKPRRDGRQLI